MRIAFLLALSLAAAALAADPVVGNPQVAPHRHLHIVLVGDSTVTDAKGWGGGFAALLGSSVRVVNAAEGGRSSKSFRAEGFWDKAVAEKGDLMLIQFGHNDQPGKGPDRETDAATTFKDNMVRYAREAAAAGFRPILVTSLTRRKFGPDGKIQSDLAPYAEATKAAAQEAGVPVIDLHALSLTYFDAIGKADCERLEPRDEKDGKPDSTHLSEVWKEPVARLVIGELAKLEPAVAAVKLPATRPG